MNTTQTEGKGAQGPGRGDAPAGGRLALTPILLDISTELLATHDLDHLLPRILHLLHKVVDYDAAAIHMVEGDRLRTLAAIGKAAHTVGQSNFQRETDPVWRMLEETGEPCFSPDVHQEEWTLQVGFEYIRSFIAAPLQIRGRLLGILTIDHPEPNHYTPADVEVVRIFANYAAIALENAQLMTESRGYIRDLELLHSVGLETMHQSHPGEIIRRVLSLLDEAFGYPSVSFYKVVGRSFHLIAERGSSRQKLRQVIPRSASGPLEHSVRRNRPLLLADALPSSPETAPFHFAPDVSDNLFAWEHLTREEIADPLVCEHACVYIPVHLEQKVYGVLRVEHHAPRGFMPHELRLLASIVQRMAIALHNAALHEDQRRRLTTLSALHEGALDISSDQDEDFLLRTFVERIKRLLGGDIVTIFLYDATESCLVLRGVTENPVLHVGERQEKDEGIIGRAFSTGMPVHTSDYGNSPYRHPQWPQDQWPLHAVSAVPLLVNNRPIGVLAVHKLSEEPFDAEEMQLLALLAGQIATALENRRLFRTEQLRTRQLLFLSEITAAALQNNDFQEMLNILADQLGSVIDADGCYITLWDEDQQRTIPAAAYGPLRDTYPQIQVHPGERTLTGAVLQAGAPLMIEDVSQSTLVEERFSALFPSRSLLGLPLIVRDRKIGAAILAFDAPHRFTEEEVAIGQQAAAQVAVAIDKAQLLDKEQAQRRFVERQLAFSYALMEAQSSQEALRELLGTLKEVIAYDAGSAMLLEPHTSEKGRVLASEGYTDPQEAERRVLELANYPLLQQLRRERAPIYLADLRTDGLWQPGHRADPQEVRSILIAPLLQDAQSEMIGAVTLKSYIPHAFPEEVQHKVLLLCNQAAAAVERIRLHDETRRRLEEMEVLAEMSEDLNRSFDLAEMLPTVLQRVMRLISQSMDAPHLRGAIILHQKPSPVLHLAAGYNLTQEEMDRFNSRPYYATEGTFAVVLGQGEWVELTGPDEVGQAMVDPLSDLDTQQLLNIPLKVGAEAIGLISANYVVQDPTTRRLLGAIAELAGSAIHKAQLLADARRRAVELMEAYEALQFMDRQRDEFIQNITHDLRAPLTFIQGYTELMLEGALGEISDEQRDALTVIQERTEAVKRLVEDILQVKAVESLPLQQEPVSIEEIAYAAVRGARMAARQAGLDIVMEMKESRSQVLGDAARLGQVFENLLSNAIKYSPNGGVIRVRVESQNTHVVVSVADPGIGIPPEEIGRIWDRYYRAEGAKEKFSGVGLGLANVRRIIEAHGGRIWVQSDENGTIFTFELPRYIP